MAVAPVVSAGPDLVPVHRLSATTPTWARAGQRGHQHDLTRKWNLSRARGSAGGAGSSGPPVEWGPGQAAGVLAGPAGSGPGMRQRVTSKPRAPSLPTW